LFTKSQRKKTISKLLRGGGGVRGTEKSIEDGTKEAVGVTSKLWGGSTWLRKSTKEKITILGKKKEGAHR